MAPSRSRKTRSRGSSQRTPTSKYFPAKSGQTNDLSPDETDTGVEPGKDNVDNRDRDYDAEEVGRDEENDEEGVKEYDSDALDDDDFGSGQRKRKRRMSSTRAKTKTKRKSPTNKKSKTRPQEDEDEEYQLEDGQEIVGAVVQAPTTGQVPPGQISQNTLNFLRKLQDPKYNDREWFKLHEPVYRQAEVEWKAFVDALTDDLTDADPQVPPLPAKDVIYRIYRDIRFSNDKTPYKKGFSASFSRGGRKSIFAGYHVFVTLSDSVVISDRRSPLYSAVQPGGHSLIAAGSWCPGRTELANIRTNIQNDSARLRRVLSAPGFIQYFGEPSPRANGGRQSVFGMEDELKVAPKGVDKGHRDIDLLKCRSFVVVHRFTDEEALAEGFKETVAEMVRVMRPFVHCLNDMMTVGAGGGVNGSNGAEEDEEADVDG